MIHPYLIHMLGRHVTLEIDESLRKGSPAIRTDETAVRAVVFQQVLYQQMVIAKLVAAARTFEKVFASTVGRFEGIRKD